MKNVFMHIINYNKKTITFLVLMYIELKKVMCYNITRRKIAVRKGLI